MILRCGPQMPTLRSHCYWKPILPWRVVHLVPWQLNEPYPKDNDALVIPDTPAQPLLLQAATTGTEVVDPAQPLVTADNIEELNAQLYGRRGVLFKFLARHVNELE